MQHNVSFETGHSGEFLVTHRTGRVLPIVGAFVQGQVEFNIKGLGALVASMWLFGEKSQEATTVNIIQTLTSTIMHNLSKKLPMPLLDLTSVTTKLTPHAPQGASRRTVRTATYPGRSKAPRRTATARASKASRAASRETPCWP